MSSIKTNAAAMTALQTLRATNKNLDITQGRISTGFRVAEASHNAAYWSIATTMRSDNKAMSTVQDALGLGAAQVDVAYTAMDAVKDIIDEIKAKLVAASQPGVDKSKIQSEIEQFKQTLRSIADSASFSGENWLSVEGQGLIAEVVASFIRDQNGAILLNKIDVEIDGVALFNADGVGLLERHGDYEPNTGTGGLVATGPRPDPFVARDELTMLSYDDYAITLGEYDRVTFDLTIGYDPADPDNPEGTTYTIVIDRATVDAVLGTAADGVIADADEFADVLARALMNKNINVGATVNDVLDITVDTGSVVFGANNGEDLFISKVRLSAGGADLNIEELDITDMDVDDLSDAIQGVDRMLNSVTKAASDLGAIKSRIELQKDFVSKLRDAVSRGVGQLVDADMSEESTRLQALQVQQQLGIQALSIANANAQNILALFRS